MPSAHEEVTDGEEASLLQTQRLQTMLNEESGGKPEASAAPGTSPRVRFFDPAKGTNLPLPGPSYPDQLRGIFWLDQAGSFGSSDVADVALPDLCISFADSLNSKERESRIDVDGPAWTWGNNLEAYTIWRAAALFRFRYTFSWNKDYTKAQIYPIVTLPGLAVSLWLPSFALSFTMVLQTPAPGECPPKDGASKEARSKCAVWRRESRVIPFGSPKIYYVFRVEDAKGVPQQPFYDAYVNHTKATSDPNQASKLLLRADSSEGTSFVGLGQSTEDLELDAKEASDSMSTWQRINKAYNLMNIL